MTDNKELRDKITKRLDEYISTNQLSNKDMVHIIEAVGKYLNLETYSAYARREGISYNGVKDRVAKGKVEVMELFNEKFIIDND